MDITNASRNINDRVQGHPSEFEKIDLLPVKPGNAMRRVGQSDKWKFLPRPIIPEDLLPVGTHRHDLRAAQSEFFIIIPQARQLRAAERSGKAAQEGKHDRFAAVKTREADQIAMSIGEFEIRGGFARRDQSLCHRSSK